MKYFDKAYWFSGGSMVFAVVIGFTGSALLTNFSVLALVLLIVSVIFYGLFAYLYNKNRSAAVRAGLMARAEHRLELKHEAELHSVWESK